MFEYYLTFISKNIHNLAKEILLNFYDEEVFKKLVNEFINIRYYYYYDEELEMEEKIEKHMNKTFLRLLSDYDDKDKLTNMYMTLNYLLLLDNNDVISDETVIKIIADYRREIGLGEDKVFPKSLKKLITTFKEKRKEIFKYFDTNKFFLEETSTSNINVINIKMNYDIEFPDIYSRDAIEEIYNKSPVKEERLLVEYSLIVPKILEDIHSYKYNTRYLIDFSCDILQNNEQLEKIKKFTSSDMFKFKAVFKINYDDYSKHESSIKEMIKEGYLFALEIDDEVELSNNLLFSLFKYIIIEKESRYKDMNNDKIIIMG